MDDIRPTKEQTEAALRAGWTAEEAARGYTVVNYDGTGLLQIEAIGEMGVFGSDDEACFQAARDGVKIIPVEELPQGFDRRYFGWIDTAENRAAIAAYAQKQDFHIENPAQKKRKKAPRARRSR